MKRHEQKRKMINIEHRQTAYGLQYITENPDLATTANVISRNLAIAITQTKANVKDTNFEQHLKPCSIDHEGNQKDKILLVDNMIIQNHIRIQMRSS